MPPRRQHTLSTLLWRVDGDSVTMREGTAPRVLAPGPGMLRTALCVSPGTCEPSRKGTMQASPRQRLRAPLILALAGLSLVGYAIFLALRSPSGHLASAREAAAQPPAAAVLAQARAKLKHVVFVILENRSFDSVFGRYPGATGTTTGTLPGGKQLPLPHGPLASWHDIDHDYPDATRAIDGGKMDGFVSNNGANLNGDQMTFWQFDQADIPNFWSYAQHFTLGDHMFSAAPAATFPNHLYTVAAQARGIYTNPQSITTSWGCDSSPGSYTEALTPGSATPPAWAPR